MNSEADQKYGTNWSRDETIAAFDLYCRIPFRLTKRTTPEVKQLAHLLGRTPSSVARKLGNFGSFDETLRQRGVVGLAHASKLDRKVWDSFHSDWESLVNEAAAVREQLVTQTQADSSSEFTVPIARETDRLAVTEQRVSQDFFVHASSTVMIQAVVSPDCRFQNASSPATLFLGVKTQNDDWILPTVCA